MGEEEGKRKGKLFPPVRIRGVLKQELVGSGTVELRHQPPQQVNLWRYVILFGTVAFFALLPLFLFLLGFVLGL